MKRQKAVRPPRRSRKGTTTLRRGMQWPFETDAQALDAWNRAVDSWGARRPAGSEVQS